MIHVNCTMDLDQRGSKIELNMDARMSYERLISKN